MRMQQACRAQDMVAVCAEDAYDSAVLIMATCMLCHARTGVHVLQILCTTDVMHCSSPCAAELQTSMAPYTGFCRQPVMWQHSVRLLIRMHHDCETSCQLTG